MAVKIAPNKTTGELITVSTNNPEYGYMRVSETKTHFNGMWSQDEERSALVLGKVNTLINVVKSAKFGELPGRIVYQDYVQSELPAHIKKQMLGNRDESQLKFRQAGEDGPMLTIGGERIVRFAFYTDDMSGNTHDILLQHDNGDDIREHNFAKKNATAAALPGKK